MSDRIHRSRSPRSPKNSYSPSGDAGTVDRRQLKALYRESVGKMSTSPADPGADPTLLGSVDIADDEPTRVGQGVAVDDYDTAQPNPAHHSVHSQEQPPRAAASAKPKRSAIRRSKSAKHKRGTYSKVVANHVEAPANSQHLPFIANPDSQLAASYRVLRHRLREADSPEIIAVSSPGRGEGKTTVSINLAMAIAEHGRENVLLLEANLRHPAVGVQMGFTPPSCFGQQMAAHLKSPLDPWQVVSCFFPNLHVLAVDPASVGSWRMTAPALNLAVDQLSSSEYGHIIIDCPSILESADVNIIEDLTDGILLTAKRAYTSTESLKEAQQHLAPANFLGIVMVG